MGDEFASLWFFQFTFAATSASVPSGAVAERVRTIAYAIFSFVFVGESRFIHSILNSVRYKVVD